MVDRLRQELQGHFEALPKGLRAVLAIFGILMWVLGAQYLAGDAVRLAEWFGAGAESTLAAVFLVAFGSILLAPFILFTDWQVSRSVKNAGYVLVIMAWFILADIAAEAAQAAVGVPYGATVATVFLLPFFAIMAYRLRTYDDRVGDGASCSDIAERELSDTETPANDNPPAANDNPPAANDNPTAANDNPPAANDNPPAANDNRTAANDNRTAANRDS